jgi:cell division protein FtsI (penicillin-binding protein 3)
VNRQRLLAIVVMLGLGASMVVARSVQITVFEHDEWKRLALRQQEQVIEIHGPRGTIRSADGYVLATSVSRVAIQIDTKLLNYPELFVRAASPLLGVSEDELARRLKNGPRNVWLAKQLQRERAEQVRVLAPQAVGLVPDFARIYPQGSLAAPVIGFVGREELRTVGRAGFEHHFDAYLAGEPEQYLTIRDAIQRKVRLERLHRGRAGFDLELTLEAKLQARCESILSDAMARHGARAASAVVADARTGRIFALASLPSFDPADPGAVGPEDWRLRPVQDAFEPGSTVKPVVVAAALSCDVVRREEQFDCQNRGTRIAGHWIRDHVKPGLYSLDEIVVHSANAGIIQVAERVPEDNLWRAFDAFGFGRRTGINFPAEARGLLPAPRKWSKMSRASFALGQELTVSPLQLAMAYAAIANGGWLPRPQLVVSDTGADSRTADEVRTRVLDEDLARRLRDMLEGVVREGTGKLARVSGFRAAGKTGTAQRAVAGTFDDEHHVAWFAGFLPMPDPRLVVVVAVEDPSLSDIWASTVAAPIFADIAEASVCLLDLPPTEPVSIPGPQLARREGSAAEDGA